MSRSYVLCVDQVTPVRNKMAACCADRRVILSVEDSAVLTDSTGNLTTADLLVLSVDLDLRSSSDWHLTVASTVGLLGETGEVNTNLATTTLRLFHVGADGVLDDGITLTTGSTSIRSDYEALTVKRTKALVRGLYRVNLYAKVAANGADDANVVVLGIPAETTLALTSLSAQATRVYL